MTDQPEEVVVSSRAAQAAEDLANASRARLRWEAEEQRLKALLLAELGYDQEDPKPKPLVATDPEGHHLFRVSIGTWRGVDTKYLKRKYPAIYAECETSHPTKSIKGGSAEWPT